MASTKTKANRKVRTAKKSTKKPAGAPTAAGDAEVLMDRRRTDRRDQRGESQANETVPAAPQVERRKKVNRRRQIDPTTCERDYTEQEIEFMNALDRYKRQSGRMFPTCSEVLEVLRDLGYVKLSPAEIATLQGTSAPPSAKPMQGGGTEQPDDCTKA